MKSKAATQKMLIGLLVAAFLCAGAIAGWFYVPELKCRANDLCSATFYENRIGAQRMAELSSEKGLAGVLADFETHGGLCNEREGFLLCNITQRSPVCVKDGQYSFEKQDSEIIFKKLNIQITCP